VRTVFVFLEPEQMDRLEDVEGEGPVRWRCDPEHGRLLLFMQRGLTEDTLAHELSYTVTRMAAREWMYVGAAVDVA
jgi:hypothetical protein